MSTHLLADVDPLVVARGLSARDGTVLLHTQRPWHGTDASFLLFDPLWSLRIEAGTMIDEGPVPALARPARSVGTRLEQLRRLAEDGGHSRLPFLAGYLGYEVGSTRDHCRHPAQAPFRMSDGRIAAYDAVLVFGDEKPPRLCVRDLSGLGGPDPGLRAARLLERVHAAASTAPPRTGRSGPVRFPDRAWHREAMRRIREHLLAGDTYQVNLTGFATAESDEDPFMHFLRHSTENPVAFGAYIRTNDATITSHSPERLLSVRGDRAQTAPIKGTARAPEASALRASAKDRAEHLMIVDLCRNDLGRRALTGSVRVAGLMEPLEVRGIAHLVSRIEARVRPGARGALLDSLFPGGSVTGAPKRRAMEIISAIETSARGPYTGSIGYLTPAGDMDFSIAIRTAVWQEGHVHFGCGGGIVIDSEPSAEYEEAILKTESFFSSLHRGTRS